MLIKHRQGLFIITCPTTDFNTIYNGELTPGVTGEVVQCNGHNVDLIGFKIMSDNIMISCMI